MSVRAAAGRAATALLFAVAVVFLVALLSSAALASAPASKRVLIVYESEVYSPASLELQQSILEHLRDKLGQGTEFFCEQLEATRFPESRDQALSWVRTRYAARGIDIVIFVGSEVIDILPGVRTVYAGFTPFSLPSNDAGRKDKITVWFNVDFRKTVSVARALQPRAKNVLVVAGSGIEDHVLLEEVRDQLKGSALPVEFLTDRSLDDLLYRVAHSPSDTIVIPISYSRDPAGNLYHTRDVVAALSRVSTAPLYAVADTTIGSGAVGGYVVDFYKAGAVIADVVVQSFGGKAEAEISLPADRTSSFIFDWRELKKWGFSEKNLPAGSVVLFQTTNVWEQYRWRIIGALTLMVLQALLIIALLINRRHRKHAENSLRDLTGSLLDSQDEERRRIARDLHDGTGQHLSGMALTIGQVLADFPPGHDRLRQLLQDSHLASRQALEEVRTVSYVLHPPILDGLGLVAALRWYLDGLQKRTTLKICFDEPKDLGSLSPEVERALFRITQESINNVLRHSGASAVVVNLSNAEKTVTLEIRDNGIGLSPDQLTQLEGVASLGVGIAGMRERVRQLRGRFSISSIVSGTRVFVSLPIDQEQHVAHSFGG